MQSITELPAVQRQRRITRQVVGLYLPNTHNCIVSALYELRRLKNQAEVQRAIAYLESARRSLNQATQNRG
jgi:hypothetical protein